MADSDGSSVSFFDIIYATKHGTPRGVYYYVSALSNGDGTLTATFTTSHLPTMTTSCPGLTFEGWYLDKDFTTKVEPSSSHTFTPAPGYIYTNGRTCTLYGKWSSINKIIYKGETILDLSGATVTVSSLDEGVIAWDANGFPIIGGSDEYIKSSDWQSAGASTVGGTPL